MPKNNRNHKLTKLCKYWSVSKRFYPKLPTNTSAIGGHNANPLPIVPSNNNNAVIPYNNTTLVIPYHNTTTALIPYDKEMVQTLSMYKNSHNPRLALQYKEIDKIQPYRITTNFGNAIPVLLIKDQEEKQRGDVVSTIRSKPIQDFSPEELKVVVNSYVINKIKFDTRFLTNILSYLNYCQEKEELSLLQKETFLLLKTYFRENPPNIEHAELFLKLWQEGGYTYTPSFKKELYQITDKPLQHYYSSDNNKTKLSFEEKEAIENKKISTIVKRINTLFYTNENKPLEIISSPAIQEFYQHVDNRGSIIPLSKEEIIIYDKLKELRDKHMPKKDSKFLQEKDNLKDLKKESNLPLKLKTKPNDACILPQDYIEEITRIKEELNIVNNPQTLLLKDLKIIATNSGATTLDEEKTFKVSKEAYESINDHEIILGLKSLSCDLKNLSIKDEIKKGNFVIFKEQTAHSKHKVLPSYLSHKTFRIKYKIGDKDYWIAIGYCTSARDDKTIVLDEFQQVNTDVDKQDREQRYRIFSKFMCFEPNKDEEIDLEMMLYVLGNNSSDNKILDIIANAHETNKDLSSQDSFRLQYTIDEEFIRQLTLIFLKKRLHVLEHQYNDLNTTLEAILNTDKKAYDEQVKTLQIIKEKKIQEKMFERYQSSLPQEFKDLISCINKFETILEEEISAQKKKNNKKEQSQLMKIFKEKKDEELNIVEKTAKQKKEDYLKNKQKLNHEQSNPSNKKNE